MSSDNDSTFKKRSDKSQPPPFGLKSETLDQSRPSDGATKNGNAIEKPANSAARDENGNKDRVEIANPGYEYKSISYNEAI